MEDEEELKIQHQEIEQKLEAIQIAKVQKERTTRITGERQELRRMVCNGFTILYPQTRKMTSGRVEKIGTILKLVSEITNQNPRTVFLNPSKYGDDEIWNFVVQLERPHY